MKTSHAPFDWIRPARIDRERLEVAKFPITIEIPIRFDDLDTQGHVNNAAAAVILQEARVGFNHRANLPALGAGLRPAVAALRIEFAAELHYPGVIEVCTGVVALGRSSFTLIQVGRQNLRPALYGECTIVVSDENGPSSHSARGA